MNHGYCKNCWWWKYAHSFYNTPSPNPITNLVYLSKETEVGGVGKCYMQNSDAGPYTITTGNSYCLDYINRKKEEKKSGTLEEWIRSKNLQK